MAKETTLVRYGADFSSYEKSIKEAQRTFETFTRGLGVNVSKISGVAAAIGAVSGALKVAKDAFFQSESNIDEWGRTVEGAKGAYSTFLNTLNSGNWSNFFTNLATAVQGARDLYDALDRLGSIKANNQAAIAIVQQQIAQLRLAKQQGEDVDAQLKSATEQLRALQNQSVVAGQTAGNTSIRNTLRNRVNAANTTGVDIGEGTYIQLAYELEHSGQAVFDSMKKTFDELAKKATAQKTISQSNQYGGASYSTVNYVDINKLTAEEQKQYLIAKAITEGETEIQKGLAIYAQAIQEGTSAAREEFKGNRYALQGSGGKGGNGGSEKETYIPLAGSIDAQIAKVKELQDAFNKTADQSVRGKLLVAIDEATRHLAYMKGEGAGPLSATTGSLSDNLGLQGTDFSKIKLEGEDLEKLQTLANAGEAAKESWTDAMGAISGIGGALAAIEDPAVKVLGIIAEAIATVALSFAKALSKDTKLGVFGWIAAAAAGTATMIATISSIKSATAGSYAEGGIVPGNSYSGDRLQANVNSGELILNAAQQNTLAAQLRQGYSNNMHLTATIKGTDIQLALNNTSRQQGRGTYVTAR